ncbi:MAG: substrate-binding domain-containing protein [Planctomycetota bacterium]|jgi:phosphonate transport system substrate-binding protein
MSDEVDLNRREGADAIPGTSEPTRTGAKTGGIWVCAVAGVAAILIVYVITVTAGRREPRVDLASKHVVPPPPPRPDGKERLRFAVATMISAEETFSTYRRLVERIGRDIKRREVFVLRPSYAEVRRELERGKLDVALVCTGTYVHSLGERKIKLLVQPEFESRLQYRSVLLVPAGSSAKKLEDLRGKVMALTDLESNTGCLVPSVTLLRAGHDPKTFFRKVIFTRSHDRSIRAVALATVDAAAVDALVWESHLRQDPSLAARVRVIWQSVSYGPPPVVVPRGLSPALQESLRRAFLDLDKDPEGREILSAIGIRRFVPARPEDYQSAIELYREIEKRGGVPWR